MSSDIQNCPIERDERSCRTCRHYEFYNDREQDEHGTCFRHAPTPRLTTDERSNDLYYAEWPLVRFNARCGDWQWDETIDEWIDNPSENQKAQQAAAPNRA